MRFSILVMMILVCGTIFAASGGGGTIPTCIDGSTLGSGTWNVSANLAGNLSEGNCINVSVKDIVIDCQGFNLTGNDKSGHTNGIYVNPGLSNVTIQNCRISNYTDGIRNDAQNTTTINNTIFFGGTGVYDDSDNIQMMNDHIYQNDYDVELFGEGKIMANLTNVIFDSPQGNFVNYTNFSMVDTIGNGEDYAIYWIPQPGPLDTNLVSVGNKYLRLEELTDNPTKIDQMTFYWNPSDVSGMAEAQTGLYLGAEGWSQIVPTTTSVSNHSVTLSKYDISNSASIGVLSNKNICPTIDSAGKYVMTANISGAQNIMSPFDSESCVYINSSDVVFDCAGFNITSTGPGASGIFIDSGINNVTVKNCTILGYNTGIVNFENTNVTLIGNRISDGIDFGIASVFSNYTDISENEISYITEGMSPAGIQVEGIDHGDISGNIVHDSGFANIIMNGANNSEIEENNLSSSFFNLMILGGNNGSIEGNMINDSVFGLVFANGLGSESVRIFGGGPGPTEPSIGYSVSDNDIGNTAAYGVVLSLGNSINFTNDKIHDSAIGAAIIDFDKILLNGTHLYNDSEGIDIETPSGQEGTIFMKNVVLGKSSGYGTSDVNITLTDLVDIYQNYSLSYIDTPAPPSGYSTIGKSLNISRAGPLLGPRSEEMTKQTIDSIVWNLNPSNGFDISKYALWNYSSGWDTDLNNTPDVSGRTLSLADVPMDSVYSILGVQAPSQVVDSGSSGPSRSNLQVSRSFNCSDGELTVSTGVPNLVIRLIPETASYIEKTTDPSGDAVFTLTSDGSYQLYSDQTGEYNLYASDPFELDLCQGQTSAIAPVVNQTGTQAGGPQCTADAACQDNQQCINQTCVTVTCSCGQINNHACTQFACCSDDACSSDQLCQNHVCVAKPVTQNVTQPTQNATTGPTQGDAQSAIDAANSAISSADNAGKDTSGAKAKLDAADAALSSGDYATAIQLADEAVQMATNAKSTASPTATSTTPPPPGFPWLLFLGILVLLGLLAGGAYYMTRGKKR